MGFWDFLRRSSQHDHVFYTPRVTVLNGEDLETVLVGDMTPTQMWNTQPHLRTTVTFLARNIAQLGLHTFTRDGDDRQRDRTSTLAQLLRRPNRDQTAYELIYALVGDVSLYDRAYWLLNEDVDAPSGWTIRRLPPSWVSVVPRDAFGAKAYDVHNPTGGKPTRVPADSVIAFTGYHPSSPRKGSPTIEALKDTLQEQIEAATYRRQVWKRGGRVSAVIERPADAPDWTDDQAKRFREDWYSKFTGNGPGAGGTPILEDGMKLSRIDFNAQEQQFVEAAKLALTTVAAAFHVNPTMIGVLDNANYSNVREFRRMLYGDTLGPILAMIEDRLNTFLVEKILPNNAADTYLEFNIQEKLKGSFEEQAAVMSTLVGRPIMTADEARGRFNLPSLGGDAEQLVTPLNVLMGGQASPTDSGTQNLTATSSHQPALKAPAVRQITKADDKDANELAEILRRFFGRQRRVVLSALGAGESQWWDEERWNGELAADLHQVAQQLADKLGSDQAAKLGYRDTYNTEQTVDFLREAASRRAVRINETTKAQLDDETEDPDGNPAGVFDQAEETRADGVAAGVTTFLAAFAATEAARQIARTEELEVTKTWVTGANARDTHRAMNGETVPINEPFSNGMDWPGDSSDVDEVAGCNCTVTVTAP